MMRRIVSAGLPSHVPAFLARQLEDVSVLITFSGDEALTEVQSGRCGLLLLNSDVPGISAESVLRILREDPQFNGFGVVYCLAESDKANQEILRQHILREFQGIRVLLHPLGLAEIARVVNVLLEQHLDRELRVVQSAPQPAGPYIQSPSSLPLRRAS
jgi:CheY-like chemotaxis protein